MARIAGVTIPNEKRIEVALTYIFGIGLATSQKILTETKISPDVRTKDLREPQVALLRDYIEKKLRVEGDLRREIIGNVKRLKDVACYRGIRHIKRLPVHGQRTRTNTRTVRGNVRRTMGSGKRILTKT